MTIDPWKLSTLGLAGALAFCLTSTTLPEAAAESQPRMRAALQQLRGAKSQLEKATHDKGGHRAKALQLTKQAIEQVEAGIAHDKQQ